MASNSQKANTAQNTSDKEQYFQKEYMEKNPISKGYLKNLEQEIRQYKKQLNEKRNLSKKAEAEITADLEKALRKRDKVRNAIERQSEKKLVEFQKNNVKELDAYEQKEYRKLCAIKLTQIAKQREAELTAKKDVRSITTEEIRAEQDHIDYLLKQAERAKESAKTTEKKLRETQQKPTSPKEALSKLKQQYADSKDLAQKMSGNGGGGIFEAASSVADAVGDVMGKHPLLNIAVQAISKLVQITSAISAKVAEGVQEAVSTRKQYMAPINARLQGISDNYFEKVTNYLDVNLSNSPYIKQQAVIENVSKLVEAGIAYNVEERSIIQTLSNKMVTTFDTLDATLTRLIRLNGADLTTAQLGAEAQLNNFLSQMFSDTSYLTDMYDSIANAIIDATSQLDYQSSVDFQYAVQKWLGSLYSVGMSSEGVTTLAKGINALATGDVDTLNSNSQLQTLFALAAQKAGLSYSSILRNGLNSSTTDALLSSVVSYLSSIVNGTSDQVTKSAWGNITNMSVSDLRALTNLSAYTKAISNESTSYKTAISNAQKQLQLVSNDSRTTQAEKIENLISNFFYAVGENTIEDKFDTNILTKFLGLDGQSKYWTYAIGNAIGGTAGSILQFISVADSLFGQIESLYQDVTSGFSSLDTILSTTNLTMQQRGSSMSGLAGASSQKGISYSVVVSNGSSKDKQIVSLAQQAEKASQATAIVTSAGGNTLVRSATDIYSELFEQQNTPIRVQIAKLEEQAKSDYQVNDGGYLSLIKNKLLDGVLNVDADITSISTDNTIDTLNKIRGW